MKRNKRFVWSVLLLIVMCLLGACGAKDTEEPVPDGSDIQTGDEKPPKPEENHGKEEVYCNHSLVIEQAVDATCTAAGRTEGIRCTKCGEVRKESQTIPALAHAWLGAECASVRTCFWCDTTSQGVAEHTYENGSCRRCGEMKTSEGLVFQYSQGSGTYTLIDDGDCYDAYVIIPATVEGKPVTSIGSGAFAYNKTMVNVYIPDTVTGIRELAFNGCISLESITIPAGVTYIADKAFARCSVLKTITVEEGNQNYYSEGNCIINSAGTRVVLGCQNSVIPEGITEIGSYAFYGCEGLKHIDIPDSVINIGNNSFAGCGLEKIVIPDHVSVLDSHAFSGCLSLKEVHIGKGLARIGSGNFSGCKELKSIVIPENVTYIADFTFTNCVDLNIFCEVASRPTQWYATTWNQSIRVYWKDEWHYVDGVPTSK